MKQEKVKAMGYDAADPLCRIQKAFLEDPYLLKCFSMQSELGFLEFCKLVSEINEVI